MVNNLIVDKFAKLTYHITRLSRSLNKIKGEKTMFINCTCDVELTPKSYRQIKEIKRRERLILDVKRTNDFVVESAIDFYYHYLMEQFDRAEGVAFDEC